MSIEDYSNYNRRRVKRGLRKWCLISTDFIAGSISQVYRSPYGGYGIFIIAPKNDAKHLSRDVLRHRRLQGARIHQYACVKAHQDAEERALSEELWLLASEEALDEGREILGWPVTVDPREVLIGVDLASPDSDTTTLFVHATKGEAEKFGSTLFTDSFSRKDNSSERNNWL